MSMLHCSQVSFADQVVLIRTDYNISVGGQEGQHILRFQGSLPTIAHVLETGGTPVVLSHMGRPRGQVDTALSLQQVVPLFEKVGIHVVFVSEHRAELLQEAIAAAREQGGLVLVENVRFDIREEEGDMTFAQIFADVADAYINDAFSASHRSHATLVALPTLLPSYAGMQLVDEVTQIHDFLHHAPKPMCVVMGGAKVETKLPVIRSLMDHADLFLIGGGIANSFLYAQGHEIGLSLAETEQTDALQHMMLDMEAHQDRIFLPTDVVVADDDQSLEHMDLRIESMTENLVILDIGQETQQRFIRVLDEAKSIIWNGPLGKYELPTYRAGTEAIVQAMIATDAQIMVGGGDSLELLAHMQVPLEVFDVVSTAGGAMLEFVAKGTLPGLEALGYA